MKKILVLLLALILSITTIGCGGNNSETDSSEEVIETENQDDESEKSEEEKEVDIKDSSVRAEFEKINGNKEANGMRVFAEGEISVVDYDKVMDIVPSFLLTQEEGDGYGVYHISNIDNFEGLKDGDIVTVYGVVTEPTDDGIPKILTTLIEPKGKITKEPEPTKKPNETLSQKNAIGKANTYLSVMAFSKSGLVTQLEFDGFENGDATYAVENIEVDWKEQAVKKGKTYLDVMSYSRSGLIEQLEFDGFSNEEATYAVDKIGL